MMQRKELGQLPLMRVTRALNSKLVGQSSVQALYHLVCPWETGKADEFSPLIGDTQ
jgi:hypothetical protein